jgi:hypothetical protein
VATIPTKPAASLAHAATRATIGSPAPAVAPVPATGDPAPVRFHPPAFWRLFSLFGVIVLAVVTALMAALAVLAFTVSWIVGLIVTACAFLLGALTGYVWRDFRGKWGLRVLLGADAVTLDLPSGRSLIHRVPVQHRVIPYADIDGIETRAEAYSSLGQTMIQRAYVLRRKNGELIFLFEDRAQGSAMEVTMFAEIAAAMAARAGIKLHDIGMVEGHGGLLGVWGAHSVPWSTPSLPLARQLRLWRHAAFTGGLVVVIIVLALVVRLIAGG